MSEDDFYNKKLGVIKLLIELNSYAKSTAIDYFAEDLNDIDIDDDVLSEMYNGLIPCRNPKKLPKYIRTAR